MNGKRALRLALGLTLGRLIVGPLFFILYVFYETLGVPLTVMPLLLLGLLLFSELSDILDGVFARRYNQVTQLGKVLDPMADSIVRMAIFFTFTQGLVQLPMLLIFV